MALVMFAPRKFAKPIRGLIQINLNGSYPSSRQLAEFGRRGRHPHLTAHPMRSIVLRTWALVALSILPWGH